MDYSRCNKGAVSRNRGSVVPMNRDERDSGPSPMPTFLSAAEVAALAPLSPPQMFQHVVVAGHSEIEYSVNLTAGLGKAVIAMASGRKLVVLLKRDSARRWRDRKYGGFHSLLDRAIAAAGRNK